jgi:hypothetical protein
MATPVQTKTQTETHSQSEQNDSPSNNPALFGKAFKTAVQNVKNLASSMIKEDCTFCCQIADVQTLHKEETIFPSNTLVDEWLHTLFTKELKPKPIPEKALKAMAAKGNKPKKQPSDIMMVVIMGSETHVHLAVAIPQPMTEQFSLSNQTFVTSIIPKDNDKHDLQPRDNYIVFSYPHEYPFKEKDQLLHKVYDELKIRKIYVPDEEEDEEVYNLSDFDE